MRICVLMAAFNEENRIGAVVRTTKDHVKKVVVVNDGSEDGTGDVARAAGAVCFRTRADGRSAGRFLAALIPAERALLGVEAPSQTAEPSTVEPPDACDGCALAGA